jgi:CMP-N,N'-diacetyllegionaminic acid synthase
MSALAVIIARGGSKGLPEKCVRPLCGRPVLAYTIDHAQRAEYVDAVVVSTDSARAVRIARTRRIDVIDRPAELATDTAPVDATIRHALEAYEAEHDYHADVIVLLAGNVPVRAEGIVDRCIEHLLETGADSVRTVSPVGKMHPDWMYRLDDDRMIQYRDNVIHRRQDLEPLYVLDGSVYVMTRGALYSPPAHEEDYQAFLGEDRRAVVQRPEDTVDIDTLADFYRAEAMIRLHRDTARPVDLLRRPSHSPVLTGAVAYGYHERR